MTSNGLAYTNAVVLATLPTGADARTLQRIYPPWLRTLLRAALLIARRRYLLDLRNLLLML